MRVRSLTTGPPPGAHNRSRSKGGAQEPAARFTVWASLSSKDAHFLATSLRVCQLRPRRPCLQGGAACEWSGRWDRSRGCDLQFWTAHSLDGLPFLANHAQGGNGGAGAWARPYSPYSGTSGGEGGDGEGGALDNYGTSSIASSTFAGNDAVGGWAVQEVAGAVEDLWKEVPWACPEEEEELEGTPRVPCSTVVRSVWLTAPLPRILRSQELVAQVAQVEALLARTESRWEWRRGRERRFCFRVHVGQQRPGRAYQLHVRFEQRAGWCRRSGWCRGVRQRHELSRREWRRWWSGGSGSGFISPPNSLVVVTNCTSASNSGQGGAGGPGGAGGSGDPTGPAGGTGPNGTATDWIQVPTIQTPPQTQTAEAGSAVDLLVDASSPFPLFYQWYLDGTNLTSWSTNCDLQLTNVQFSQSGAYTVVMNNELGAATSAPAMLNVIASVERRPVPGVNVTGETSSLLNVDYAESLSPAPNWTTLGSVSLTSTSGYYFDLTLPLPPQRFYRAWQTGAPGVVPPLDLHIVPAITLTGNIGASVRLDYINQFGPIDAWFTLDTVTLTNTSQLYFDVSALEATTKALPTCSVTMNRVSQSRRSAGIGSPSNYSTK